MEFDYGLYADDGDHYIDLRNPHFRQDPLPTHATDHFGNPSAYGHHLGGLSVDVKPRLTKEQHDILESHYQQQNKPNTQTKKGFAEALNVSLDKVNNWFQNRRAKSKQDAKKQAGAHNMLQTNMGMNHNQLSQLSLNTDNISPTFCPSDYYNSMRDSAVSVDPMALQNGLGIRQTDQSSRNQAPPSYPSNIMPNGEFASTTTQAPRMLKSMTSSEWETHRRTLTQEEFDSIGKSSAFVPTSTGDHTISQSPQLTGSSDLLNEYFPELCDFGFDNNPGSDTLVNDDAALPYNAESYATTTSTSSDVPSLLTGSSSGDRMARNPSTQSSMSEWSENSTPSVSITPARHHEEPFSDGLELSPRAKSQSISTNQWQPGQSVPVDYVAMDRDFRQAAVRNGAPGAPETSPYHRAQSIPYTEQQLAYSRDESFLRRESQLAKSIGNLGIGNEHLQQASSSRGPSASGSIASRRQRPRPVPLSSGSLRSTSYCGQLPVSPSHASSNQGLTPGGQTLRRIKSNNVMNGIASGRIQKNVGMAQRSPLNFTFADQVKYARSASCYSPASALGSANLAPPTPLSPTELSGRLDLQRQLGAYSNSGHVTQQPSISEANDDRSNLVLPSNGSVSSQNFTSPPSTPMYAAQFARGRLGSAVITENTPPQSAPATQQTFAIPMYSQPSQSGPILQSHGQHLVQVNEYPQMPHVMMPYQQQMSNGNQFMDMSNYGNMPMQQLNYGNMAQFSNGGMNTQMVAQPPTPPNSQFPFVPSSPGVLMATQLSSQGQNVQHKSAPAADFYVHEYSPPQDMKRTASAQAPRKANDAGPRNYTFANHGPEHFEKGKKNSDTPPIGSISPISSAGGSSSS